jgi:hypothetical protein
MQLPRMKPSASGMMWPAGRTLRNRPPDLLYQPSFCLAFGITAGWGVIIQLFDFKNIFTERTNLYPTSLSSLQATGCLRR